jgi:hypothetical protein
MPHKLEGMPEMNLEAMLNAHPAGRGGVDGLTLRAAQSCLDCAQICVACADACLAGESVDDLRQCIRMNLDCADLCSTAGLVGARPASYDGSIAGAVFGLCAEMCRRCGDECMRHAPHHEHCRLCAEACRSCEQACRNASAIPDLH